MSKPTKYDRIKTEFTITKSETPKRYHFEAKYCNYLNYMNGTPNKIAKHISKHMEATIRRMNINNATKITIRMSWK